MLGCRLTTRRGQARDDDPRRHQDELRGAASHDRTTESSGGQRNASAARCLRIPPSSSTRPPHTMGNQSSHPSSPRQGTHGSSSPARGPPTPTSASTPGSTAGRHRALSLSTLLPSASAPIATGTTRDRHRRAHQGAGAGEDTTPSTPPLLVSGGHLSPQGPSANALVSARGQEGLASAATPGVGAGGVPGGGAGYNVGIVKGLILEKRLAPFYRGLDDYEPEWTDEGVAHALRESRTANPVGAEAEAGAGGASGAASGASGSLSATSRIRHAAVKADVEATIPQGEREAREARAYRGAVECPICFLVSAGRLEWPGYIRRIPGAPDDLLLTAYG